MALSDFTHLRLAEQDDELKNVQFRRAHNDLTLGLNLTYRLLPSSRHHTRRHRLGIERDSFIDTSNALLTEICRTILITS